MLPGGKLIAAVQLGLAHRMAYDHEERKDFGETVDAAAEWDTHKLLAYVEKTGFATLVQEGKKILKIA